jgi:CheY-specific phosphatase CheX
MEKDHSEIVSQVFCDVVEQMAFMFGEPVEPQALESTPEEAVQVEMSFGGPASGILTMALDAEAGREIAANMMGAEPDSADLTERAGDAVKELLNVTCGHVATALVGGEYPIDMSVPVLVQLDPPGWRTLRDDERTLAFLLDDRPVLLRFVPIDG